MSYTKTAPKNWWPTNDILLLMQAALLDGDEAIHAYNQWQSHIDIDLIEYPSYQILPKLYKNLKKLGISSPHLKIFEGVYRRTWTENQKNFYFFSDVLEKLKSNGLKEVVLLKGAAMTLSCYKDFGIRLMGDIDFLIEPSSTLLTTKKLLEMGFKTAPEEMDVEGVRNKMKIQHGVNFLKKTENNKEFAIDLHWSILEDISEKNIDSNWIKESLPYNIFDTEVSVLNPSHLLYQTCIHGNKYSPVPLTRWVMDAVTLIQLYHEKIDWEWLLKTARSYHQLKIFKEAFIYLKTHFKAPIPDQVMKKLENSWRVWLEPFNYLLSLLIIGANILLPCRQALF